MASITQTIPSYNGGISQQPDELKFPGQVKDALNVLPDLTHGLLKRPGGRLIASLSDGTLNSVADGKWFHYYRDEDEQYIGQISRTGDIQMWKCSDGSEQTVTFDSGTASALATYLTHTNDEDLQTLTLNDYTYITNRTKTVDMAATTAAAKPHEAYIDLKKVAYASQYSLNLFDNNDLTEITSATRIDIETVIDSKQCGRSGIQSGTDDTKGKGPPRGVLCGSKMSSSSWEQFTIHAGVMQWDNVAAHTTLLDDACCPNVGTEVFAVTPGEAWKNPDQNSNGVGGVYLVNRDGTNYVNGEVHTSALFNVANSTGYTLVVDPSGINDTLTFTTDGDATFDELIEGLKADADYDSSKYTIQRAGHFMGTITPDGSSDDTEDEQEGRVQVLFKEHTGTKSASTWQGSAISRTTVYYAPNSNDLLPATETFTISDSIKPKNLYFRVTCIGQGVSTGTNTVPKYSCRYTVTIDLLHGGSGWKTGDYFYVWLKNAKHKIIIADHSTGYVQSNLGLIRPTPTPFDNETVVTAESILSGLREKIIEADPDADDWVTWDEGNGYGIKQIGNGLYIKRKDQGVGQEFNISSAAGDLLNLFTDKVKNVADLPTQCRHGYVVTVSNSEETEDDFYVKFFGNNDSDGDGVWEECPQPGVKTTLDPGKMPIQLVRQANGTFKVEQVSWDLRLVGDTTTVPEPSFIGKTINKMLFFRNRMVMLSDENVIMSRPGSFYNFWPKTAATYTATDNIDISCSSEFPAIVYDGIQVNSGLLLFTKNQQFMLTTDSDVLSPQTAKINSVSTYNFNYNTNPISLGTTVGFLDNAGKNTRFFEMSTVLREGQPDLIEQTKVVSKLFPKDITIIANSRENSTIFFSEKNKDEIYGFRYFSSIEKRMQSAWFRWKLNGDVQHLSMLDDALYAVVRNNSKDTLQKFSIKLDDSSNYLVDDLGTSSDADDIDYKIHLDNATKIAHGSLTYDATNDWTTFTLPDGFNNSTAQLSAVYESTGADKTFQGRVENVYTFVDGGTTKVKLSGNWKTYDPQGVDDNLTSDDVTPTGNIILGYLFDMEVKFPTLYYLTQAGEGFRAESQGSLILHRLKFSFGPLGVYETKLERRGKPDYTELYESIIADQYISNRVQFTPDSKTTLPVYEKNTNVTITLKSTHPSPATLYSMSWEGDYTNKFYRRV